MKKILSLLILSGVFTLSCSSSKSTDSAGPRVAGQAQFRKGGTPSSTLVSKFNNPTQQVDGNWRLSPDQAKINFVSLDFIKEDGSSSASSLTSCEITYNRQSLSGSQILNCDFTIEVGTYVGMIVYFEPQIDILISDSVNNIYTTTTSTSGFSNTSPTGGAEFVTFTVSSQNANIATSVYFSEKITITEGSDKPTLSLIVDLSRTLMASMSSGQITLQDSSGGWRPVELAGFLGQGGYSEFYSSENTAGNAAIGNETYMRVFYDANNKPIMLASSGFISGCHTGNTPSFAYAASPNQYTGVKLGGFLGLDNTDLIAWALPQDNTWSSYAAIYTLERKSTIGSSALLKCKSQTTAPDPISGYTYSSGAPTFTADTQKTLFLVTK